MISEYDNYLHSTIAELEKRITDLEKRITDLEEQVEKVLVETDDCK